jgi:hypothetical protein
VRRSYTMFGIDRLLSSVIVNRFKSRSRLNVVLRHGLSDLRVVAWTWRSRNCGTNQPRWSGVQA